MKTSFLTFAVFLLVFDANAQNAVKVVDGDSLEINGASVRLVGIDSPEYLQLCNDESGNKYECGQQALEYMQDMVAGCLARKEDIRCEKKGTDRYKRDLSICYCGGLNLNEEMVKAGWAVTYRHEMFKPAEEKAKKAKSGIWQGRFMRPELYRVLKRYSKT